MLQELLVNDHWVKLICVLQWKLSLPAGMTAFLRSQDPRCESRPRCHRLPKSAYEASLESPPHPLYAPRPLVSASADLLEVSTSAQVFASSGKLL